MSDIFDISLYNDEFFEWHYTHVHIPMLETGKKFMLEYKVESIVDFGCGIGSYLLAAYKKGVPTIQGYEIGGNHAKRYTPDSIHHLIDFSTDITKPMNTDKFDYSFCIEVAEHVEPSGSKQLVSNIVNATNKMIVFTASPKQQDGCGHINTHSKIYWINLFEQEGVKYSGKETKQLKELWSDAPDYVLKNLMIFLV
jgi:2-polyprenyl-3-methyl-5-hydroxy-6-metoxy-1,4-benzoquinol methylase